MNTSRKLSYALLIPLFALHAGQLLADQFVVDNPNDPASGNPAACVGQPGECTLRDALAAADLTAQMDSVVFDLSETIHLQKALVVSQPVTISGSGDTTVRVNQAYHIALFEGDTPVLQPSYYSERGNDRAMLKLYGAGSVVENMVFDGSITPHEADVGVEYIDYESDNECDNYLYIVSANAGSKNSRWPIAGGINTIGRVTIRNSAFEYFDYPPITIDYSEFSSITDNVISGGAIGQGRFHADGISLFGSVYSVVSGNRVSGYRNGITFFYCSALEARGNELKGNLNGLELDNVGPDWGPVLIENNNLSGNLRSGLYVATALGAQVTGNTVNNNLEVGIHIKAAGDITMTNNKVNLNGSGERAHGGILINEGSGFVRVVDSEASQNHGFGIVIDASFANTLSNNKMSNNTGAGLVLLGGAQDNNVLGNELVKNYVGAITGDADETLFPSNNTLRDNRLFKNVAIDALDFDPDCNDEWSGNSIGTSFFISGACAE